MTEWRHVRIGTPSSDDYAWCQRCGHQWPCDAEVQRERAERAEARLDAAGSEGLLEALETAIAIIERDHGGTAAGLRHVLRRSPGGTP